MATAYDETYDEVFAETMELTGDRDEALKQAFYAAEGHRWGGEPNQ